MDKVVDVALRSSSVVESLMGKNKSATACNKRRSARGGLKASSFPRGRGHTNQAPSHKLTKNETYLRVP
jgi:hypothetical protein